MSRDRGEIHEQSRPPRRGARTQKQTPPSDGGMVSTGAAEMENLGLDEVEGEDAQIGGANGWRI